MTSICKRNVSCESNNIKALLSPTGSGREGGREGGREAGRDGGREGGREGRREGGREGGREGRRDGGREGGRECNVKEQWHRSFAILSKYKVSSLVNIHFPMVLIGRIS